MRNKKECMLFKIDFEKAYDCVSWNDHIYVLQKVGFGNKRIKWMEANISSSSMEVLINGSLTLSFQLVEEYTKGILCHHSCFLLQRKD